MMFSIDGDEEELEPSLTASVSVISKNTVYTSLTTLTITGYMLPTPRSLPNRNSGPQNVCTRIPNTN